MHRRSPTMLTIAVPLLALLAPLAATAATFVVNTTADGADAAPGDGVCATAGGLCTLRAARDEANALAGADTVAIPAGTYTNHAADYTEDVTIVGQGAGVTILQDATTMLAFDSGVGATVRGITFTQATSSAVTGFEADLLVEDCEFVDNDGLQNGGGLNVYASLLTVRRSMFVGNDTSVGGGIFVANGSTTMIDASVFEGNTVQANGSAIHHQIGTTLVVTNSTFSGNTGGSAIVASGDMTNSTTLVNVTMVGNERGLGLNDTAASITNTIIAGNLTSDCAGEAGIVSGGGNLSSDASCNFVAGTDLGNTDPLLGALADNGGPTKTHALGVGSPAIDTAVLASCPATDQRGAPRPVGLGCDRGAFEVDAVVPTTTSTTFPTTSTSTSSTTSTSSSTSSSSSSTSSSTSSTSTSTSSSTSSSTSTSTTSSSLSTSSSTSSSTSTTASTTSTSSSSTVSTSATSSSSTSTTTSSSSSSSSSTIPASTSTTVIGSTTTTSSSSSSSSSTIPATTSTTVIGSTSTTTSASSTSSTTMATSTSTIASSTSTSSSSSSTVPGSTTTTSLPTLPPPALIEGQKLLLKAKPENDAKRRLVLIARGAVTLGDGPGSADDPTQAGVSATVRIVSETGGVDVSYPIAEPGTWRSLKRKKPEKGYKYAKGTPVTLVVLKTDRQLKIVAKGPDLVDLLATNPDPVEVELRIGVRRWCMTFGDGAWVEGKKYLAKRTGVAEACPRDPSS